jgi:hypothetical protein
MPLGGLKLDQTIRSSPAVATDRKIGQIASSDTQNYPLTDCPKVGRHDLMDDDSHTEHLLTGSVHKSPPI